MEANGQSNKMLKRIVITGAESTGKTTLCRALADYHKTSQSSEFVRTYVETLERPINEADLEPIIEGQLQLEKKAVANASNGIVFHDTNLLSNKIYIAHYFEKQLPSLQAELINHNYNYYFLCLPDVPWVEDPGQRESPEARQVLHQKFHSTLKSENLPFSVISGSHQNRLEQALHILGTLK